MARVIRGDGAKVIPAQVVDAHAEADQILADARARAEAIEAEARDTIEASVRATLEAELAAAWLEVEAARQAALEGAHESVAELALAVAGHLVHDAIEAEPGRVRALVDDALSRVRRARAVKVRVHPEDAPALGEIDAELVPDDTLGRGDCVVESDLGEIDARLSVRLEALRRALR